MSDSLATALKTLEDQAQSVPDHLKQLSSATEQLDRQILELAQQWSGLTAQSEARVAALHQAGGTLTGELDQHRARLEHSVQDVETRLEGLSRSADAATQTEVADLGRLHQQEEAFAQQHASLQNGVQQEMERQRDVLAASLKDFQGAGDRLKDATDKAVGNLESAGRSVGQAGQTLQQGLEAMIQALQATAQGAKDTADQVAGTARSAANTAGSDIESLPASPLGDTVQNRTSEYKDALSQLSQATSNAASDYQQNGLAPYESALKGLTPALSALYLQFQAHIDKMPDEQKNLQASLNEMLNLLKMLAHKAQEAKEAQENIFQKAWDGTVKVAGQVLNFLGDVAQNPLFQVATGLVAAFVPPPAGLIIAGVMAGATALTNVARSHSVGEAIMGAITPVATVLLPGALAGPVAGLMGPALSGLSAPVAGFVVKETTKVVVQEGLDVGEATLEGKQVDFIDPLKGVVMDGAFAVGGSLIGSAFPGSSSGGGSDRTSTDTATDAASTPPASPLPPAEPPSQQLPDDLKDVDFDGPPPLPTTPAAAFAGDSLSLGNNPPPRPGYSFPSGSTSVGGGYNLDPTALGEPAAGPQLGTGVPGGSAASAESALQHAAEHQNGMHLVEDLKDALKTKIASASPIEKTRLKIALQYLENHAPQAAEKLAAKFLGRTAVGAEGGIPGEIIMQAWNAYDIVDMCAAGMGTLAGILF